MDTLIYMVNVFEIAGTDYRNEPDFVR